MEKNDVYRKMYFRMAAAAEDALRIIIAAQRECEEMLLDAEEEDTENSGDNLRELD